MRHILMTALLCLAASAFASAQASGQDKVASDTAASDQSPASVPIRPAAQQTGYGRPNAKVRRGRYLKGTYGPFAFGKSIIGAGISTWRNTPREWGGQWEGFGKRVASNTGHRIISNTVSYGLDEAFTLDSHFYRSDKRDFGSRVSNALISSVTARNSEGKRVIGFPRFIGTYSASVIAAETWYPKRYTYKDGLRGGTISIASTALINLFTEFIRRK